MIVENPYTDPHFLKQYFPIKPKVIDKDRTKNGDYYKKPTQYWFVGCEPEDHFLFEPLLFVQTRTIDRPNFKDGKDRQINRSLMHPQYADRFIRTYVLD